MTVGFDIITLFPEMFTSAFSTSLLGKAIASGQVSVDFVNPRDFTEDKHRSVDDTPYGGGAGMVMRPGPLVAAIEHAEKTRGRARKILLCPSGAPLSQSMVNRLAREPRVLLVCGRYEGFDERIIEILQPELLSVGDFVLSGGEVAAMVVIDAVARLIPGVLGDAESAVDESFGPDGGLEYPHFTRPREFRGLTVPDVLLSGDHAAIARWRREHRR